MTFVHPLFLWALTAVAVPVIIHLFSFRRHKKVYFTNVKFLKELRKESKSRSRLREILVLAARCLLLACLALAFAQPYIPLPNQEHNRAGARAVGIYIDNSFSMNNVNRQGPLLELAKTRAKELVKAFDNSDRFQIITNDFEGKHQRLYSKDDAVNIIGDIKASPAIRKLSDVLARQTEFLNGTGREDKRIYLISDAQRSTFNLQQCSPDTAINTTIIPLEPNRVNNIFVDSCWFETPLQQKGFVQKLHARIVNNGSADIDVGSARLFLNKAQTALASFSVQAGGRTNVLFTFECRQEGFNYGSVKIEDYPITFDDEVFFAFNSRLSISVCLINGKSGETAKPLESLFCSDSLFKLKTFPEQTIDYGVFKTSDVIVLNQLEDLSTGLQSELLKFTQKGGGRSDHSRAQRKSCLLQPGLNHAADACTGGV